MDGGAVDANHRLSGVADTGGGRVPARKDRDRILYSTEFRRLAGVTQVASATENLLIHNRITHSIKVEQVGTSIVIACDAAQRNMNDVLGADSEWRVAAAGLGHDLGHPPFGHVGEAALNAKIVCERHRLHPPRSAYGAGVGTEEVRGVGEACGDCLLPDGFEGNAQSFRIVTKLAVRAAAGNDGAPASDTEFRSGLDLTAGTLAALVKYPWLRGDRRDNLAKWGAYDCDAYELAQVMGAAAGAEDETLRAAARGNVARTIEAEIMDWADDITYAVHDIDDFYRLGLVPLGALRQEGLEQGAFFAYADAALAERNFEKRAPSNDFLPRVRRNEFAKFPEGPFESTPLGVAGINGLVSHLIDFFVANTSVENGALKRPLKQEYINAVLKQLTWYYVIDNPALATIQDGQRRVIGFLFDELRKAALEYSAGGETGREGQKRQRRLPPHLKDYVQRATGDDGCRRAYGAEERIVTRAVVDFIASLTDRGAYKLYARLSGDSTVSILEPVIAV